MNTTQSAATVRPARSGVQLDELHLPLLGDAPGFLPLCRECRAPIEARPGGHGVASWQHVDPLR